MTKVKAERERAKKTVLALGVVAALGVCDIGAYFTANDAATNTFTVSEVKTDLQEPKFDELTDTDKTVTPNKTITKDPQVKNTGKADQFVFVTVEVPVKNIVTAKADGTRNNIADTELFSYTTNAGWTQVGSATDVKRGDTVTAHKYTYVWGSGTACTSLAANATTGTLFDSVTFVNAVEGQGLENTSVDIPINAFAIQTSDLGDAKTTAPAEVLAIYQNQDRTTVR